MNRHQQGHALVEALIAMPLWFLLVGITIWPTWLWVEKRQMDRQAFLLSRSLAQGPESDTISSDRLIRHFLSAGGRPSDRVERTILPVWERGASATRRSRKIEAIHLRVTRSLGRGLFAATLVSEALEPRDGSV